MNKSKMKRNLYLTVWMATGLFTVPAVANDMKPGQWRVDAQQGRFSALLDGNLLDDEQSFVRSATDRVDSWARSEWRISWHPEVPAWDLQWAAFVDAQAHVNGAGARAVARINNPLVGATGTRYPFMLDSVKYRRLGISLLHPFQGGSEGLLPGRWTVGASVFGVDQFKSVNAMGVLEDRAGGNLALQAATVENELGKQSTFVQPNKILGWGFALDVSALWGQPDASHLRLSVRDLGPAVRLREVLGTDRTINTDTVSFDQDGYIQFAPVIRGVYVNREASVRIKPEVRLEAGWQFRPGQRLLSNLVKHGARQEVGLIYQQAVLGYRLDVGAHVLSNMPGSASLGLFAPRWGVSWRGDNASPSKARIWALSGHFTY